MGGYNVLPIAISITVPVSSYMVGLSQETWDELSHSTSCSWCHFGLRIGLPSPGEIKPQVSGVPLGSDNTVASTQKSAWPTVGYALRSGFSPSFCSMAHCALVGVNPVIQRHVVYGLQQPSVF